MTEKKQL